MAADDFGGSFVYLVGGPQHVALKLVIFKFLRVPPPLFGNMIPNLPMTFMVI